MADKVIGRPPQPLKERFEKYIKKTDGCWLWTGSIFHHGYGKFRTNNPRKTSQAHRVAYELYVGPLNPELCVCHTCDNPLCVNPDHLWAGTFKENSEDRNNKGRTRNQWTKRKYG